MRTRAGMFVISRSLAGYKAFLIRGLRRLSFWIAAMLVARLAARGPSRGGPVLSTIRHYRATHAPIPYQRASGMPRYAAAGCWKRLDTLSSQPVRLFRRHTSILLRKGRTAP